MEKPFLRSRSRVLRTFEWKVWSHPLALSVNKWFWRIVSSLEKISTLQPRLSLKRFIYKVASNLDMRYLSLKGKGLCTTPEESLQHIFVAIPKLRRFFRKRRSPEQADVKHPPAEDLAPQTSDPDEADSGSLGLPSDFEDSDVDIDW